MSKVICDVCGTTYPETASQCPICGSAKASGAQTAATGAQQTGEAAAAYSHVKGGRFSKTNVRKRKKGGKTPERRSGSGRQNGKNGNAKQGTNWSMIVVILLLLAIIAVVVYIFVKILGPGGGPGLNTEPNNTTAPGNETVESTLQDIPCTGIELSNTVIVLEKAGDAWLLAATPAPTDTTDEVIMKSENPAIATVTPEGNVVAVSGGETVITVTCGEIKAQCRVVCSFGDPTQPTGGTEPSNPTEPTEPPVEFKFNTKYTDSTTGLQDTTMLKKGEKWNAYRGSISPLEINWITDDPNVCTISNGLVTAVGRGKTLIHAEYKGQTFSCIVRCSWKEEVKPTEPEPTQSTESTEGTGTTEPTPTVPEVTEPSVKISHTDVTLLLGTTDRGSFYLKLKENGNTVDVVWTAQDDSICKIEGNKITGTKVGYTNISTTYKENVYACKVIVAPAPTN